MATLSINGVRKSFGTIEVLSNIDLEVEDGGFLVLLGPSGCGKSTLLSIIAGLEPSSGGDIFIGERKVNNVHPKDRNIAMVFQSYALYPTMQVRRNIGFGLEMRKVDRTEREAAVQKAAELQQIEHLLDRKPGQLSGGQRQRVAMGRAIVRNPQVFLFDEPLSNLDAKLRVAMRTEIKELHQRLKTTIVYVTHDQIEAMTMANKIVVMRDGRVEQVGKPLDLYDHPENLFVASFIGSPSMNFMKGKVVTRDGRQFVEMAGGTLLPLESAKVEDGRTVTYGIRPEHISIGEGGIPVKVSVFEPTGSETLIFGRLDGEPIDALLRERIDGEPGQTLSFRIDPRRAHVFDNETGKRL